MPAYNGDLFDRARAPLLERTNVPDAVMAPIIDMPCRAPHRRAAARLDQLPRLVGFAFGRHLRAAARPTAWCMKCRRLTATETSPRSTASLPPASFARKVSGSYYTHDDLVRLVLRESVGLLAREKAKRGASPPEEQQKNLD